MILLYFVIGVVWGYWDCCRFLKHLHTHYPMGTEQTFGWGDAPVLFCTGIAWPFIIVAHLFWPPCSLCRNANDS